MEGRKRSYILTEKGENMLKAECERMAAQLADYQSMFGKENKK